MYIKPISATNNSKISFNSNFKPLNQILKPQNVEEKIKKISQNKEAKDIFKGLSLLAASLIAEVTAFTQQNEDAKTVINGFLNEFDSADNNGLKDKFNKIFDENTTQEENVVTFDINKVTEEKPERELYLKITSYFPNLDTQYRQMLQKSVQKPDDEKNKFVLSTFENILKMFSSSNTKLMYMKPYLDILERDYSDCLDCVAENISSTVINGDSPMSYMVLLHNGTLTKEDVQRWSKCKNLSSDEFLMTLPLSDEAAIRLSNLKETNNHFKIKRFEVMENDRIDYSTYTFMLDYIPENLSVAKRLKTAAQVHEAIYGEIHLKSKDVDSRFLIEDIQNELIDNIVKDRRMDATYNFVKYIKPAALQEFSYTADEIKFINKDNNKDYNKIKSICTHVLMNLDFANPKLTELCEVLNDEKIFNKVLTNRHAKIRFITRFILKDNPNPNLREETSQKLNILLDEIKNRVERCNFFCYIHSKGTSPQFYLGSSKIGNFIKITLNNEGTIHTIYEDFNKELKFRNMENQENNEED